MVVTKKFQRRAATVPPPARQAAPPPPSRGVATVPAGAPPIEAPTPHVSRAPSERGIGRVPNPRTLKLVRDVAGGELLDLFAVFPDLPRPRRPAPRLFARRPARRG